MKLKTFLIFFVILIGVLIRIYFYSFNRYFWLDEAALALNIVNFDNFFKPLNWDQVAPPFFMYISKFMYTFIPNKELAVRFFPLLFSIGSIFAFNKLADKYFDKFLTKFLAVSVFCFSYPLIYYAQEFKQYSLDVFIFLLILLSYDYLKKINGFKQKLIFAVLYSLSLYTSFTAAFATFVIFLNLLLFDFKQFKKCCYMLVPIFLAGLLFLIMCHSYFENGGLHTFWEGGFFNFDLKHNIDLITSFFSYIFSRKWFVILFLFNIFMLIKNKLYNEKYGLLFMPVILAVILSFLHIYPIQMRVSLYLLPLIIILTLKFADFIDLKNKTAEKLLLLIFGTYLMFPLCRYDYNQIIKGKFIIEDIVTPIEKVLKNVQNNDIIIIADNAGLLYEYYKNFFVINNPVIVEKKFQDENDYIKNLNGYEKGHTYHLIFAHKPNRTQRLTAIYNWAKIKDNFYFEADKNENAIVRFRL